MDDTRFILDFLSELEKDLRKIGLSSIIDLHVRQNDILLESPKTLGVMYVDDIPMYILTSHGRVRLLNDRHHLKMMDKKILQELKDLFFFKYNASLSSYKLNSSKIYSIKKVSGKLDNLDDIVLRIDFLADKMDSKSNLVEPIIFDDNKRIILGLKIKLLVMKELKIIQKDNGWRANYLTLKEFMADRKRSVNFDSNQIFLTDDDINNIGNLVELGIVKIGLMSGNFHSDIRDFCYNVLTGLQLYLGDLEISKTEKSKLAYQLDMYITYFTLSPKEERGPGYMYDYNKTFLQGIGVFEVLEDDEVVVGYSEDGSINIDNSNDVVLRNKKLERIRRYYH